MTIEAVATNTNPPISTRVLRTEACASSHWVPLVVSQSAPSQASVVPPPSSLSLVAPPSSLMVPALSTDLAKKSKQ